MLKATQIFGFCLVIIVYLVIPGILYGEPVTRPLESWFDNNVICTRTPEIPDSIASIDIVIVLDTTGSMALEIAELTDDIVIFMNSLDSVCLNYALGLVTFADGVRFPDGHDLTTDSDVFYSWINHITVWGGGEYPEVSLDAIVDAVHEINWRPGSQHFIVMITDASFHEAGDGSGYSDVTPDSVAALLYSSGIICNIICPDSAHLAAYHYNWYQTFCDTSLGEWFELSTPLNTVFSDLLTLSACSCIYSINVVVSNNSGTTLNPLNVQLFPESCITIVEGLNPQSIGPVFDGDTADFLWIIRDPTACSTPDDCFLIKIWSDEFDDTSGGCWSYGRDCSPPFVMDAGPDIILCQPDSVNLGGSPTGEYGIPPYAFVWSPFVGLSCFDCPNPTAYIETTSTFQLTAWDYTSSFFYDTVTIIVSNLIVDAGFDAIIAEGDSVVLGGDPAITGGIPPYTISWIPTIYLSDPTEPKPICTPETSITYILRVTDSLGCVAGDTVIISIFPSRVEEQSNDRKLSLKLYTWNSKIAVKLELPQKSDISMEVYNLLGIKISIVFNNKTLGAGEHHFEWDASTSGSGIYFAKIQINERIFIKKILLIN